MNTKLDKLLHSFERLAFKFLPKDFADSEDELHRSVLFSQSVLIGLFLLPILALSNLYAGFQLGFWGNLVFIGVCIFLLLALRQGLPRIFLASFLVIFIFSLVNLYVFYTGGIFSPILAWLLIVPFIAHFYVSAQRSIIWSGIVIINIVIFFFLKSVNKAPFEFLSPSESEVMAITTPIALIVFVMVHLVFYAWVNQNKQQRLLRLRNQLEKKIQSTEKIAFTDALTGLPNRYYFTQRANEEILRSSRFKTPIALAILDIDYFKQVNDQYGHEAGDICLMSFGALLTDFFKRPTDIIARYGGEEFIILLTDIENLHTIRFFEKFLRKLENSPVKFGNIKIRITASIGLTTCIPRETVSLKEIFNVADKALYTAKDQGRNTVVYTSFHKNT